MIKVKEKSVTTSKEHLIPDADAKRKIANKKILAAVLEEQKRQNGNLDYCSRRIINNL